MKKTILAISVTTLVSLASLLSPSVQADVYGLEEGQNFELYTPTGETFLLEDYFTGQYLILDFSAPWCGACVELAQRHDVDITFHTMIEDGKCQFATLTKRRELPEWVSIFEEGGFMATHSFGSNTSLKTIAKAFNFSLKYIPTILVIDKNGKLVASDVGNMPHEVEKLCQ